jgi:hypothetical protein
VLENHLPSVRLATFHIAQVCPVESCRMKNSVVTVSGGISASTARRAAVIDVLTGNPCV